MSATRAPPVWSSTFIYETNYVLFTKGKKEVKKSLTKETCGVTITTHMNWKQVLQHAPKHTSGN